MSNQATVVDGDRIVTVGAVEQRGTLLLEPADLERATGWDLRTEGLCRGDVCVPVRDRGALVRDGAIDLAAVADALHRPFAVEPGPAIAILGDAAEERAEASASLRAPAFVLPDLDGEPVALADFRGRKKVLLAWASW